MNLIVGLLIGLALGVSFAFLRVTMDNSVKSPDKFTEPSGATPLRMTRFDPDSKDNPLIDLDQRVTRAEVFRSVRTNFQHVDVGNPPPGSCNHQRHSR